MAITGFYVSCKFPILPSSHLISRLPPPVQSIYSISPHNSSSFLPTTPPPSPFAPATHKCPGHPPRWARRSPPPPATRTPRRRWPRPRRTGRRSCTRGLAAGGQGGGSGRRGGGGSGWPHLVRREGCRLRSHVEGPGRCNPLLTLDLQTGHLFV